MKGSKVTFQLPFMAENDKKFSAKRFFNLSRTIFRSQQIEMNIMNALVIELKDEGSFYKIPV